MFVFPSNAWPKRYWPKRYWPVSGEGEPEPEPVLLPDLSWVNGVYSLVLVADERGRLIGEMPGVESLTWVLNGVGQTQLPVARPGDVGHLIEFGNRVLVYLDNGLPVWVGLIDPPRGWRYGYGEVTAYSGERLLTWRVTGRNRVFSQSPRAAVLRALLAEQAGPHVVEPGYIDLGGDAITDTYNYENLLNVVTDDHFLAAVDFSVTGVVEDGRIRFKVNLWRRRGRDLPNAWLIEGHNAVIEAEEQGPIINEWLTAGSGNSWSDVGRLYGRARDDDSVERYGLRQAPKVWSDVHDQATLDARTAAELAMTAEPYLALSVDAINLPPARFGEYDVGDGVGVETYSMANGYRGTRRVVGREFRPGDGACRVVLV